jgi:hypothetical protein
VPTMPDISLSVMLGMNAWTIITICFAIGFTSIACIVVLRGGTPTSALKHGALGGLSICFPVPFLNLVLFYQVGWSAWHSNDSGAEG